MDKHNKKQAAFFDNVKNQYPLSAIVNPPLHTQYEVETIINKLSTFQKDGIIVDFGAGSGRITVPLLQKKFLVYAVDISVDSLKKINEIAKKFHLPYPKSYSSLEKITSVDAIVGADILHHIDLETFFTKFYSVLNKDGKLVFSEPNTFNISWYIYLAGFHNWQIEKGMMQCRYFHIIRLLKIAGFTDIRITGLGLLPLPLFNWSKRLCKLNAKLGNVPFFKLFAYRFIIEAKKN